MRINLRSFDYWTNSICQYQGKDMENSKENINADVGLQRVIESWEITY